LQEVNETLQDRELTLEITYEPISLWKWTFLVQMEKSLSQQDV
jgi:hypothetical protein